MLTYDLNSNRVDELNPIYMGKVCSKCGGWKLYGEFHKDCTTSDGYKNHCKECMRGNYLTKNLKTCPRCNQEKRVVDFYKLRDSEELSEWCVDCYGEQSLKVCTKCGEAKEFEEFHPGKGGRYGLYSICRICSSEKGKGRRKNVSFPRTTEGTKVCLNCEIEQDISEFPSNKNVKDGLSSQCRTCHHEYDEKRRSVEYPRRTEGTKVCFRCKVEQDVSAFPGDKTHEDGLNDWCRSCHSELYEERKNRIPVLPENGLKTCADCGVEQNIDRFGKKTGTVDGLYYYCWDCHVAYQKKRMEEDVNYKIALNLRRRLAVAIKKGYKVGSAVSDLGCSIEEFKVYLESLFYLNPETGKMMTWEDWSLEGWQIHHIKPLSSFDLTDREQLLKACHYTNLRPLWLEDHIKEHKRLASTTM